MQWIHHTSKHIKRFRVQVSIPFNAEYIAIIRLLVTSGGHLEFSHEKMDGKKWRQFFQSFCVNISEKTQSFKIYMKSYWTYICYITAYNIYLFFGHINAFLVGIGLFYFFIKIIVAYWINPTSKTYKNDSEFKFLYRLMPNI